MKKIIGLLIIILSANTFANTNDFHEYNPTGKIEFIFSDKHDDSFSERGYTSFCKKTDDICPPLSYDKYKRMKGYFHTKTRSQTKFVRSRVGNLDQYTFKYSIENNYNYSEATSRYYLVTLENGEDFYYFPNINEYDEHYAFGYDIEDLNEYEEDSKWTNIDLIPNSKIKILYTERLTKEDQIVYNSDSKYHYKLSNGKTIYHDEKITNIKGISEIFGNNDKITNTLINQNLEYNSYNKEYSINHRDTFRSGINISIFVSKKEVEARFNIDYISKEDFLVDSFKVIADDYIWESKKMDFFKQKIKANSISNVNKYFKKINRNFKLNNEYLEILKKIANSRNTVIRFYGEGVYKDVNISDSYKKNLSELIELSYLSS